MSVGESWESVGERRSENRVSGRRNCCKRRFATMTLERLCGALLSCSGGRERLGKHGEIARGDVDHTTTRSNLQRTHSQTAQVPCRSGGCYKKRLSSPGNSNSRNKSNRLYGVREQPRGSQKGRTSEDAQIHLAARIFLGSGISRRASSPLAFYHFATGNSLPGGT